MDFTTFKKQLVKQVILFIGLLLSFTAGAQQIEGVVVNKHNEPLPNVQVAIVNTTHLTSTNETGFFTLSVKDTGRYELYFSHVEIGSHSQWVSIGKDPIEVHISLTANVEELTEITIYNKSTGALIDTRLKDIEGTIILASKKNDLVLVDASAANKATDNARQLFAKVPGLNIWESDNAGLQLGIGVRGLSPNRTSNFNTRQNGYDIAADALGYPESYYTPPSHAVERIEVVRGAASLQYGTQFGGMLNFKMKGAPEKEKFAIQIRNSGGSFGLWNSYNSVGGRLGKFSYFAYSQLKRGQGWRHNSDFSRNDGHINLGYQFSDRFKASLEYTTMNYLTQQAGGLTDRMFEIDPRQTIRTRNWFSVKWNIASLNFDYILTPKASINSKTFGLMGQRMALGYLGTSNAVDPMENRDLLWDHYRNFGHETRFIQKYKTGKAFSALATGVRLYQGNTHKQQGDGSDGNTADFAFLNPNNLERSDFTFPSRNLALFAENSFAIGKRLTITPGVRYEWIQTQAEGTFRETRTNLAGDTIFDKSSASTLSNTRGFALMGLGAGYKINQWFETYGNMAQNYRAINFNDMKVVNPNFSVDPNLQDEHGFNADLGIRGRYKKVVNLDISGFFLSYQNKIGEVLAEDPEMFRVYRFRTNISDALTWGLESFIEADLVNLVKRSKSNSSLLVFGNLTLMDAYYTGSKEQAFYHKKVEQVPAKMLRTGATYQYKELGFSWQYSHTSEQFTDATNTVSSANAIHGVIPAFGVMDCSIKYQKSWLSLNAGVNNLLNHNYFTRRAAGYPGPGVIPSDGRNWFVTVGVDI